jgi:hypothetical protein
MEEEKLVSVGDRVTVDSQNGVFFVLSSDDEWQTVSLLPLNIEKVLDNIPVSSLKMAKSPGPHAATRAGGFSHSRHS